MSALAFVHNLLESGRVRVDPAPLPDDDIAAAVETLDGVARREMAGDAPRLDKTAAIWAVRILYAVCQALVYREMEADAVRAALSVTCPVIVSPEVCYSVDLSFRYLPDLIKPARGIAEQDPLVEGLLALARAWPLSSVGVPNLGELDATPLIGHSALRQLYVDRILEQSDTSRLDLLSIREAAREALGAFPDLSPRMAAALHTEASWP